jgi:hypothetical protein
MDCDQVRVPSVSSVRQNALDEREHVYEPGISCELPANLLPSFLCDLDHTRGGSAITYSLEVVGERAGIFRENRRIRRENATHGLGNPQFLGGQYIRVCTRRRTAGLTILF